MKYYKIDIKTYYDVGRVPSYVNGDNIPNAEVLFKNMRDKDKINIPVLDYFFLESFDKKEYWEWMLCDVYSFIRLAGYIQGWLISKQLKSLLERYNLSNPQYFYPSKLLYKNTKLDYYIFQFAGKLLYKKTTEYIDYKTSEFLNSSSNALVNFDDNYHYVQQSDKLYFANKVDFIKKKIVLKEELDFFPMQSFLGDNIVSEQLKTAIEENGIEGFEFSELDYKVMTK